MVKKVRYMTVIRTQLFIWRVKSKYVSGFLVRFDPDPGNLGSDLLIPAWSIIPQ